MTLKSDLLSHYKVYNVIVTMTDQQSTQGYPLLNVAVYTADADSQ